MKKKNVRFLIIPVLTFICCALTASAAYYERRIPFLQGYNNVGGGTKITSLNYVEVSGLSIDVTAVTFTPINSSGNAVGSEVTVYDGYSGHITHSVRSGGFIDLKFRNHYYTGSSGLLSGFFYWN